MGRFKDSRITKLLRSLWVIQFFRSSCNSPWSRLFFFIHLLIIPSLACSRLIPSTPTTEPLQAAYQTITALPSPTRTIIFTQSLTNPTSTSTLFQNPATITPQPSFTPTSSFTPSPQPTSTIAYPSSFTVSGEAACVPKNAEYTKGTVVQLISGDTIAVEISGEIHVVHYINLYAPEAADEATVTSYKKSDVHADLVLGKPVILVKDVSQRDKFNRLPRYVFADEVFINYELARYGLANVIHTLPDVSCYEVLKSAEGEAQEDQVGRWSEETGITSTTSHYGILLRRFGGIQLPPGITGCENGGFCNCSGTLYRCSSFATQKEAQACYNLCLALTGKDIHRLDRDYDGKACEGLP